MLIHLTFINLTALNSARFGRWFGLIRLLVGKATFYRRRDWAQEHYSEWQKVFLYGGRVDLREYQKFNAYYSQAMYEKKQDLHLKYLEEV